MAVPFSDTGSARTHERQCLHGLDPAPAIEMAAVRSWPAGGYARTIRRIMTGTLGPDVARAAVAFRRNHPEVPALNILGVCMRQRSGCVRDFGDALGPGAEFAALLTEAFSASNHGRQAWTEVLPWFAARY